MKMLEKVDYEKNLENKIESLQKIIEGQNKIIVELTSIFKVKNMAFCFVGKTKKSKKQWTIIINSMGGKVSKSPNSYCTYCINNDTNCKSKIARKCLEFYKHIMLTEKQLEYLINNV